MRIRKILMTMLALAIAIAFSPLPELQAAAVVGPDSRVQVDNITHHAAAKKKKKKKAKKRKGKKAKSKGAGRCGANMYYSRKAKKCMDARDKK